MSNVLSNAVRLVSTPGMAGAYSSWVSTKMLSKESPAITSVNGTSIWGLPSFSEYWAFYKGLPTAEEKLIKTCLDKAGDHSIAIDIGANLGLFTVALASLGYSDVHAFEPILDTFDKLKENVSRNDLTDRIHLNCSAIGKEAGTAKFKTFEKSPAINRMMVSQQDQVVNHRNHEQISNVRIVSLDSYCFDNDINHIDLLKIDVEGMEPLVIEGARDLLLKKKASVVLIEMCPANLNNMGFSVLHLSRLFEEVDYTPYRLNEDGCIGKPLSLQDLEAIRLENIVLLP